ncbi:sigma-70 family RNA polymerase sigma factor [Verrucomicrobiales bacterium]|jgi:RNA polymerase sigma factor (sigma-70 family)|nr:sigma-70 family RNA polymerase sigma factor [Verrucomicrobiales bacterium]MDC0503198.1 sigma-70 family RNA polymerase sigma factor [Verrucomicrobiales bacterium]MDF1788247.1 sigma-70 family RNA polymerase sigma factor [Verrucomicrobiales bacterium]
MSSDAFFTTRWTRVARSRGNSEEAKLALSELCEAYYDPVHGFIRVTVRDNEKANDLTQGFFANVLSRSAFDGADPNRGRFRAFLLGAIKHYLWDRRRHKQTAKRGGGEATLPLEEEQAASAQLPPDQEFDRRWALTILGKALTELRESMKANDDLAKFDALKPWLTGDSAGLLQTEAAVQLGLSESATKVAIHRLRRRFRETVKAEIAQTLDNVDHIDAELAYLQQALRP